MLLVRRRSAGWVVLVGVFLSVALVATPANAAKNGAKCKIAGATEMTKGVTYKCKISNGKLKWVKTSTNTRVTSDQVDVVTGFQVKAIYVVPLDGVDHSYDTNGDIAGILDEGNKYLQRQLGLRIPIDKYAVGYDVQYMKSNLSTEYLRTTPYPLEELFQESMDLRNSGTNQKNYIFFVDINRFKNGTSCGTADSGDMAIVAIGRDTNVGDCRGKAGDLNVDIAATTWVHELFHNFGVSHTVDDPCDLMAGIEAPGICLSGNFTIDRERSRYVGSSLQGQDILQLPVWERVSG